jgi:hypothetical protein
MNLRFVSTLAMFAAVLCPSVVRAQRGAHSSPSPAFSVRRSSSSFRTAPLRTGHRSGFASNGTFTSGFGLTNIYPGTGLGINGINSILVQPNLGVEAAIDPVTQLNLALAQRLMRGNGALFPGGGYYLLTGGGAYPVPVEPEESESPAAQPVQQPQVIVLQQGSPAVPQLQKPEDAVPILPDVGPFTLVLKDGKQIQAIAFTHMDHPHRLHHNGRQPPHRLAQRPRCRCYAAAQPRARHPSSTAPVIQS